MRAIEFNMSLDLLKNKLNVSDWVLNHSKWWNCIRMDWKPFKLNENGLQINWNSWIGMKIV